MISEDKLYRQLAETQARGPAGVVSPVDVRTYEGLVRQASWQESRPKGDDGKQVVEVSGDVWSDAIQTALDEHAEVHVPLFAPPHLHRSPHCAAFRQSVEGRCQDGDSASTVRRRLPGA